VHPNILVIVRDNTTWRLRALILYYETGRNFFRKNCAMSLTNIGRWISIVDGVQSLTQQVNYNQCQQVEPLPSSSGRLVGLLPCCGTCAHVPIGPEASRPFSLPYPLPLSLSFLISLRSTSAQGIPPTNAQCGWAHLSSRVPTPDLMSADAHHHLARSHAATMENLISLINKL
jgi:hypothetical protein